MTQKRMLIAANWKMNPTPKGFDEPTSAYCSTPTVDVIVFPALIDLKECLKAKLATGGQFGRSEEQGAFTGDVSMKMLKSLGCSHVLCGHSERRKNHGETDADVAAQVKAALTAGLIPVVCIGETAEQRDAGEQKTVVEKQLSDIPTDASIVIAYEPCWAIGSGKSASPDDIQEMHAFIHSLPERKTVRLLYGGSLNAANAESILGLPDVDGSLIGAASLKPEEFKKIVEITGKMKKEE